MFSGGGSITFGGMDSAMMLMLGGNYHSVNNINNLIGKQVGYNVRTNVLTSNGDVKSYVSKFNLGTGSAKLVLFPDSYLPVSYMVMYHIILVLVKICLQLVQLILL
jgi:hypothetical protein